MKKEMRERQTAHSSLWALRFASFSLVLFGVAGLGHRQGLVETIAFLWLLGLICALALLALLLAGIGFWRLWAFGDRAGRTSLAAMIVAAFVLAPFGVSLWRIAVYPALIDVSTDPDDPPAFAPGLRDEDPWAQPVAPIAPASAELVATNYPQVTGRRYEAVVERVVGAVAALVEERGWRRRGLPPQGLAGGDVTIEALAHSYLLGFPSDVAIRISDEGQSTYVDMRSASRHGRHDLGDNALRITRFLADLDAAMAADAGL